VALCGHWDHEPPCPLAPHHVSVEENDGELRVRILFAAEPDTEARIRQLIDQALTGQLRFPDGFTTPWRLRTSWPADGTAGSDHCRKIAGLGECGHIRFSVHG
jgi:hypothetical protein